MNRTIKDATVKRCFYETHDQLRTHLQDFVDAYNFARRLKTLKGLTPHEFICKAWTSQPHRFTINPPQQMPGLKIYSTRARPRAARTAVRGRTLCINAFDARYAQDRGSRAPRRASDGSRSAGPAAIAASKALQPAGFVK